MQNFIDRLCRGKAPAADGVGPRAARARATHHGGRHRREAV
eukprot:CAMPEP_0182574392 /NCGR_PEP_ID=MMETSP1324-20130603/24876_1 /TAXON_ID=236786 /ORGANISM="Florenciella sp., Strain RCC1587" /LENGTH=40 /DNA_ID= /DNA_START= /DNA_END= /DNA_ORIENTATION=